MFTVGVLGHFEFVPGREDVAEQFFRDGQLIVETQPTGTVWYAFRISSPSFGAFAAFASEQDREALLAAGGPKLSTRNADAFREPPTFSNVDVVASRHTFK